MGEGSNGAGGGGPLPHLRLPTLKRTGGRKRRVRRGPGGAAWLLAAALVVLGGCAEAAARSPLAGTRGSVEELVGAVLVATGARDEEGLRALLVTRDEYETWLWPEMPDGRYTPFDFVWSLNATNNRKALRQLLGTYGGLDLELVSVTFAEDPEVYESFTLHPGASVTVRRKDTGQEGILASFDVLVEYGGTWKLMNYDEL